MFILGQAPEEPLLCQFCEDYSPQKATLMCNECAFLYCGTCFDACHPSKGPLADHTIGPAVAKPQKRQEKSMQCQQHKEEKLALYCFVCKEPVCYLCKEYGTHKGHNMELLEPVFRNAKVRAVHYLQFLLPIDAFKQDSFFISYFVKFLSKKYFTGGTSKNIRHADKEELPCAKVSSDFRGDVHYR